MNRPCTFSSVASTFSVLCIILFPLCNVQAFMHLESIQSPPKRIDYLDALVENFVVPNPNNLQHASAIDREELVCIFLEVCYCKFVEFFWYYCCTVTGMLLKFLSVKLQSSTTTSVKLLFNSVRHSLVRLETVVL